MNIYNSPLYAPRMADYAEVIRATAELCQYARLYACTVDIQIGRSRGQGEVHVTVTPSGIATVDQADLPTTIVAPKT
jgi:hypothetical protein